MRKVVSSVLIGLLTITMQAQDINVIPRPAEVTKPAVPGYFVINPSTTIVLEGGGLNNCVRSSTIT